MGLFGSPNVKRLEARGDVPGLLDAMWYEKDVAVRVGAAAALGRIGDPRAVEPLFAVARDRNSPEPHRQAAVVALGKIGPPAIESLTTALEDSSADLREATARVLGRMGAPAVGLLSAALKDPSAGVREAAAKALGEIGNPGAVEGLSAALTDSSAGVRQSAAKALARIGWTSESGQTGEAYRLVQQRDWAGCVRLGGPAVDPLLAALKRRDRRVRASAAEALGKIANPRAAKALVATLGDSDEKVRRAATGALVRIMAPAAKPLAEALLDGNETRRRLAREILDRTGWSPDRTAAGASYWVAKRQWAKCVGIGARAVTPLLWALEHEDELGRAEAALALGKIGNPRAVQQLCAALNDDDEHVRMRVAGALVALHQSGKLGEEHRAMIMSRQDAIAAMHAALPGELAGENAPGAGQADLTRNEDERVAFEA
ncbi:MAG: HEAT repeat domain-containing protein [Candidatus Limnocylindrales bacterium]